MIIVIPAREGSKGLPHKNRKLFKYTADIIPSDLVSSTYVFSDDTEIIQSGIDRGFNIASRPKYTASDNISTKESIEFFIKSNNIEDELVVMLYLTYPERTWDDVNAAINMINDNITARSLLCKKQIKTSPFLILKEEGKHNGSQLFPHDLYRRQDYPKCFEISHYICIFKSSKINNLNNNMYDSSTVFIDINTNIIDIDTEKDLDLLHEKFSRD